MFPTLFTVHGLGFHTWGLMVMLAFLAAAMVAHPRAAKVGIDPDALVPLYLLSVVLGLAGARLLHFTMAEPAVFFAHPLSYFDLGQGGFAFYGGVVVAGLGGAIYARLRGIPVLKLADVAAPAIMLGLAVGRVGCFSAGCCHGSRCGLPPASTLAELPGGSVVTTHGFPWIALVFKKGVGVGAIHDVPVYPTQLWASLGAFLIFLLLDLLWRRARIFDGVVMAAMLLIYAAERSAIEVFRGDTVRGLYEIAGHRFSTSQLVSAGMVLLALLIGVVGLRRGRAPETPFEPPDLDDLPELPEDEPPGEA